MAGSFFSKRVHVLVILLYCFTLFFMHCTKRKVHDLHPRPQSTFESREIVECLINGRTFRPMAIDSASMGSCTYRQAYTGDAGYIFELTSNMHESPCVFSSITIYLDSIELRQGIYYSLGTPGFI